MDATHANSSSVMVGVPNVPQAKASKVIDFAPKYTERYALAA